MSSFAEFLVNKDVAWLFNALEQSKIVTALRRLDMTIVKENTGLPHQVVLAVVSSSAVCQVEKCRHVLASQSGVDVYGNAFPGEVKRIVNGFETVVCDFGWTCPVCAQVNDISTLRDQDTTLVAEMVLDTDHSTILQSQSSWLVALFSREEAVALKSSELFANLVGDSLRHKWIADFASDQSFDEYLNDYYTLPSSESTTLDPVLAGIEHKGRHPDLDAVTESHRLLTRVEERMDVLSAVLERLQHKNFALLLDKQAPGKNISGIKTIRKDKQGKPITAPRAPASYATYRWKVRHAVTHGRAGTRSKKDFDTKPLSEYLKNRGNKSSLYKKAKQKGRTIVTSPYQVIPRYASMKALRAKSYSSSAPRGASMEQRLKFYERYAANEAYFTLVGVVKKLTALKELRETLIANLANVRRGLKNINRHNCLVTDLDDGSYLVQLRQDVDTLLQTHSRVMGQYKKQPRKLGPKDKPK